MNICKHCLHYIPGTVQPICTHPDSKYVDFISGDTFNHSCHWMRSEKCGQEGTLFQYDGATPGEEDDLE